jgi:hypothetical protein
MPMHSLRVFGLAVAAALLAGQAQAEGAFSTPAGASFASACGGLGFSGGGNAGDDAAFVTNGPASCTHQTSVVGGTAAAAASASGVSGGVTYANSASSSAGPLAIHLQADNASAVQAAFPAGMANGGFSDEFQLGAANQTGTGVWVIPINVLGALDASGFGADALLSVAAFQDHQMIIPGDALHVSAWNTFNALNDPLFRGSPSGSSWDFENVEWRAVDYGPSDNQTLTHLAVNDTIFFAVPFTFGQAFDLGVFANVWAGEAASGAGTDPNVTSLNFHNTISWGGPGFVLTNGGDGPAITDFTISSLTGTNYSRPFTEGVPEPGAWALLLAGFGLTGAVARRRRARAA